MKIKLLLLLLLISSAIFAQTYGDIHLFQSFYRDASITSQMYLDGGIGYDTYDFVDVLNLGVKGGYGVNPDLEVNAGLGFSSWSPEVGDGESGLTDLMISGRYLLKSDITKISAGGFLTLPIGNEDIGQGKMNLGIFGAFRHPIQEKYVLTGNLGLDFIEIPGLDGKDDRETSLVIGSGFIYPVNSEFSLITELVMKSEVDYFMLSEGIDYNLNSGKKIRGSLGLGLDDGAPDLQLTVSYLFNL